MKIKQALKLGLLKAGRRIKTNGAMDEVDTIFFCGTIAYVDERYFAVARDDESEGSGRNGAWRIQLNNTRATVEFESTEVIVTIVKYYTLNLAKCKCKDGKVIFVKFKSRKKRSLKKEYTINVVHIATCWIEI